MPVRKHMPALKTFSEQIWYTYVHKHNKEKKLSAVALNCSNYIA